MLQRIFHSPDYGFWINGFLLVLRLVSGIMMLTHGVPKLEKVVAGDFEFADPIGLGEEASLVLCAFAEFFCSVLMISGIAIRFSVIPIIIVMLVALLVVHKDESILEHWNILGYLAAYFTLLVAGGGRYSFDNRW